MSALLEPAAPESAPAAASLTASPHAAVPAPQPPPDVAPAPPGADWFVWACPCCQATLRTLTSARRGNCPACGSLIEAPEPPAAAAPSPEPQPPAPARLSQWISRGRRALLPLGLATAVGLSATTGVLILRNQPWKRLAFLRGTPAATRPPTNEELKQHVGAFVHANGWSAKRAFILDASRLETRGRAYYVGRDPDSLNLADFQPCPLPGVASKSGVIALRSERPGHRPVVAAFGPSNGGWKLDWELFTQTYDQSFPQFLAAPAFPIRTFRAQVQRVFDSPAPEKTLALAVSDPFDEGQRVVVHLPMGTPIAADVTKGLPDTRQRPATVEMSWARPTPDGDWVPVLQRLVCWGWNGLTGRPDPGTPAPEANQRFTLPSAPPLASAPPAAESAAPSAPPAAPAPPAP